MRPIEVVGKKKLGQTADEPPLCLTLHLSDELHTALDRLPQIEEDAIAAELERLLKRAAEQCEDLATARVRAHGAASLVEAA